VSDLKLFNFRGPYRLRLYHQARVDDSGARVRPEPGACQQGRPGVRKWEHGRLACWRAPGRSKAVLHWTDDRTGLYGLIRADAGANQRLLELWQTVMAELMPGEFPADEEVSRDSP
jgi:hypothetical protein